MSKLQNLIEGLQIIEAKGKQDAFAFNHETLWIGDVDKYDSKEIIKLATLGFHIDEKYDCFAFTD